MEKKKRVAEIPLLSFSNVRGSFLFLLNIFSDYEKKDSRIIRINTARKE